jgi:hypothetical protein
MKLNKASVNRLVCFEIFVMMTARVSQINKIAHTAA